MIFYNPDDFERYVNATDESIIGVTSGCFDLLHPLHVDYIRKCVKESLREFYVFIDSDELVRQQKNKTPLINENDRAYMVDNIKGVSGVMIVNSLTEMSDCIRGIAAPDNKYIKIFKHKSNIYGSNLITYGNKTENIIIPDIIRFESTTQISNFLKTEQ